MEREILLFYHSFRSCGAVNVVPTRTTIDFQDFLTRPPSLSLSLAIFTLSSDTRLCAASATEEKSLPGFYPWNGVEANSSLGNRRRSRPQQKRESERGSTLQSLSVFTSEDGTTDFQTSLGRKTTTADGRSSCYLQTQILFKKTHKKHLWQLYFYLFFSTSPFFLLSFLSLFFEAAFFRYSPCLFYPALTVLISS